MSSICFGNYVALPRRLALPHTLFMLRRFLLRGRRYLLWLAGHSVGCRLDLILAFCLPDLRLAKCTAVHRANMYTEVSCIAKADLYVISALGREE